VNRPVGRARLVIVVFALALLGYAAFRFVAWNSVRDGTAQPIPAAASAPSSTVISPVADDVAAAPDPARVVVRVSSTAPAVTQAVWQVSASRSPLTDVDVVHAEESQRPGEHVLALRPGGEWTVRVDGVAGDLSLRLARTVKVTNDTNELAWTVTDGSVRGRLRRDFPADARIKLAGRLTDGTAVAASIGVTANGAFEFPFAITGRYGLVIGGNRDRRTIVTATAGQTVDAGEF